MVNLVGQQILCNKDGCVYTVETQYDDKVVLSNGRTYQYYAMFEKGFSLLDKQKQTEVNEDIECYKKAILDAKQRLAELETIQKMLYGKVFGRNISYEYATDMALNNKLEYMKIYGTKAFDIYTKACDCLGFDRSKRNSFALQKLLYAQNATKEGYSVLMLPNSDLNGQTNGQWVNIINRGEILQYTIDPNNLESMQRDTRVTFVKQKNGEYVFVGVYKLVDPKLNYPAKGILKETFKLISKNYPIER